MCLGFVKSTEGYYSPNTILKEDIRDITYKPQNRILAIYKKSKDDFKYSQCTYLAKNINIEDFPDNIKNLFDIV